MQKIEILIVVVIILIIGSMFFAPSRIVDRSDVINVDSNLHVTKYKGVEYIWSVHGGILRVEQ